MLNVAATQCCLFFICLSLCCCCCFFFVCILYNLLRDVIYEKFICRELAACRNVILCQMVWGGWRRCVCVCVTCKLTNRTWAWPGLQIADQTVRAAGVSKCSVSFLLLLLLLSLPSVCDLSLKCCCRCRECSQKWNKNSLSYFNTPASDAFIGRRKRVSVETRRPGHRLVSSDHRQPLVIIGAVVPTKPSSSCRKEFLSGGGRKPRGRRQVSRRPQCTTSETLGRFCTPMRTSGKSWWCVMNGLISVTMASSWMTL